MKKLLILIIFLSSSCSLYTPEEQPAPIVDKRDQVINLAPHDQFESKDLETLKVERQKVQVALFLPLSGKHQELGWSLANSAFMSLYDNDRKRNIELILFDTKAEVKTAKKVFDDIISRNIKLVIGPVFSNIATSIKEDAIANNISVISFSNNRDLIRNIVIDEKIDGGIFLAGMMPETQIDKIVDYSMQQNYQRFAIIAPRNQYGNAITTLYKKIIKDRDGKFITGEFYRNSNYNIDRVVNRVINSFTIDEEIEINNDTVIEEEQRQYAQVIMIPESGKILDQIIASIKKQNINEREFKIIGTSAWDNIATINNPEIFGAWFVAPKNNKFRYFEKNYYKNFGKFPPRIASISYDLVGALGQIIRNKGTITSPSASDITNFKEGFEGIDGLFRFLPNGIVQRNLAVLEVSDDGFKTIQDPEDEFLNY